MSNNKKTEALARMFMRDPVAHYAALLIGLDKTSLELKTKVWSSMTEEQQELMRPYLELVREERK